MVRPYQVRYPEAVPTDPGVVTTSSGRLRGARHGGVWRFAGIPYAAPPAGDRRWRPPAPAGPWDGVRPADAFGPIAPQPPPTVWNSVPGDPTDWDEDCLTLNVWTPSTTGRRPVMVWIHGGAFTVGSGASAVYRGGTLARRGDVVVVTVNYRLGALGFLAHPALADPDSGAMGNWALLDQLAALAWVRANAEAFGGDPGAITVFGESAGGICTSALLGSPLAAGAFHRAIIQSGPPHAAAMDETAEVAEQLAAELGLDRVDRTRLVAFPAAEIVAAQERTSAALLSRDPLGFRPCWLPVVDGVVLEQPPVRAAAAGAAADVAVLIGTNRDEASYFAIADPRVGGLDERQLDAYAGALAKMVEQERPAAGSAPTAGTDPSGVVDGYRRARAGRGEPVDTAALWTAMTSDAVFRLPSTWLAASHAEVQPATYVYCFTWVSPLLGGILGAAHSVEIPFVFGSLDVPPMDQFAGSGPEAEALATCMQDAWLAFARHGDPSCTTLGQWPTYGPDRHTMVLDTACRVEADPMGAERRLWDGHPAPRAG